ncbi:hypothetical protein EAS54_33480 [Bradyrhizobium guangzhouense]|nr:hypothetical protein EAS54_33480 [Bradyrhizobium guangzhouense]
MAGRERISQLEPRFVCTAFGVHGSCIVAGSNYTSKPCFQQPGTENLFNILTVFTFIRSGSQQLWRGSDSLAT